MERKNLVGRFVWMEVPFAEDDGRYKNRPCLVLSQREWGGKIYYLVAPKFSAVEKRRGDNEVVMTAADASAVGIDKEGVVRFNKEFLRVLPGEKIQSIKGHILGLDALKQESLVRAARRVGFQL